MATISVQRRRRQARRDKRKSHFCRKETKLGLFLIAILTVPSLMVFLSYQLLFFNADGGMGSGSNNDRTFERYRQRAVSQLKGGFLGSPVAIRCFSTVVKDWSPSASEFASSRLPPSTLQPLDADCLTSLELGSATPTTTAAAAGLGAVKCDPQRNFSAQRWALNADFHLMFNNNQGQGQVEGGEGGGGGGEWRCLMIESSNSNNDRSRPQTAASYQQHQHHHHLAIKQCPCSPVSGFATAATAFSASSPPLSDGGGKFTLQVMGVDDLPFRGVPYERERNLRKKKYVFFTISHSRHPNLCLTCPRRRRTGKLSAEEEGAGGSGGGALDASHSLVTLTPCELKASGKELVVEKDQLFYLDGKDIVYW
ncbi:hypothetical protein TYRP_005463 [Tyrophagus putrescentiae]|nr:hypothetical protein TYRP_005463 [Tyrophagus putrescentiae]